MVSTAFVDKSVIVCCGPGGVGKTTAAATIAVNAARQGQRVAVLTIDPAKRLAGAMGLEELTNSPSVVDGPWTTNGGSLVAMMLDVKETFDDVVRANAKTPQQADEILANAMYQNISESLSGTQEYMAVEKLYELYRSGNYDVIVVDTPPTRKALDFLDSSTRLTRFLDNRVFRMVVFPGKTPMRLLSFGAQAFLRVTSKVVGSQVVKDAVEFFRAFDGMEDGFSERAQYIRKVLLSDETAFVVVSAAETIPAAEARFFAEQLTTLGTRTHAFLFNRLEPDHAVTSEDWEHAQKLLTHEQVDALKQAVEALKARRFAQDLLIDDFTSETIAAQHAAATPVYRLGRRAEDVARLETLMEFSEQLFDVGSPS
jgi:anion-transporting  ArsA/GET3 family ATPase